MNIEDFIKSLKFTLEDLDYSVKNGKIKGVSNILIKGLTDLNETDRPMHCTDASNSVLYIKDKDRWEEDSNNEILEKSITNVETEQSNLIGKWEECHPNWMQDENLQDAYLNIVKNTMQTMSKKEKQKVIENVSKIVKLKKK